MSNNIILINNKSINTTSYKNFFNGKISDGVFSITKKIDKDRIFLARDNHGIKKLFYTQNKYGFKFSENFLDLLTRNRKKIIYSLKPGISIIYNKKNKKKIEKKIIFKKKKTRKIDTNFVKKKILFSLKKIKELNKKNECCVLLSGGLDSTIIAFLAKKVFKKVHAFTFVFLKEKDYKVFQKNKSINLRIYKDFSNAQKLANKLKLNFIPIIKPINSGLKSLNRVMYLIQDWRDFNVHCGVLNFELAKFIKKKRFSKYPILSGDFMNEIFADYTEEKIGKKIFYKQLKIENHLRSKFFIDGLQSSDRENGIFSRLGLKIYQPYFILLDYFKNVDKNFFRKENKYTFMGKILPIHIFKLVGKKKTRAQITDKDGGILNYFISKKIDQEKLFKIFSKKYKVSNLWMKKFINFGKYLNE